MVREPGSNGDVEGAPVGLRGSLPVVTLLGDPRLEQERGRLECEVADRLAPLQARLGHRGGGRDVSGG